MTVTIVRFVHLDQDHIIGIFRSREDADATIRTAVRAAVVVANPTANLEELTDEFDTAMSRIAFSAPVTIGTVRPLGALVG